MLNDRYTTVSLGLVSFRAYGISTRNLDDNGVTLYQHAFMGENDILDNRDLWRYG